jgi:hypothetical protein
MDGGGGLGIEIARGDNALFCQCLDVGRDGRFFEQLAGLVECLSGEHLVHLWFPGRMHSDYEVRSCALQQNITAMRQIEANG